MSVLIIHSKIYQSLKEGDYFMENQGNPGKGLSIVALILDIVSFACPYILTKIDPNTVMWVYYVAIAIAVVALILAIVGRKKSKAAGASVGLGTAVLVISIIAVVSSGICAVACACTTAAVSSLS